MTDPGQSVAERPCVVCGKPTTDRHGTTGWMKNTPRCADGEACRIRRAERRAQRPRARIPTERDIERARALGKEMGW